MNNTKSFKKSGPLSCIQLLFEKIFCVPSVVVVEGKMYVNVRDPVFVFNEKVLMMKS